MNWLYTLAINPLLVISYADIFSHPIGCLLILPIVSSAEQKLLSLTRSHLFIFVFISFSRENQNNIIANLHQRMFYLYFHLGVL